MSHPLSPLASSALNLRSPPRAADHKFDQLSPLPAQRHNISLAAASDVIPNSALNAPDGFAILEDQDSLIDRRIVSSHFSEDIDDPSSSFSAEGLGLPDDPYGTPRPFSIRQNLTEIDNTPSPFSEDAGDTTNLILDFTEQFNAISGNWQISPTRRGRASPSKSRGRPSPSKSASRNNNLNLLDFDIPPMPTPRSTPSVTPRELESLKSGFLYQISSLNAALSGKEAEIGSLKQAVGDAERRVGEATEEVREERNIKDLLLREKDNWEKRSTELDNLLRSVKKDIYFKEQELKELSLKLAESERKREETESKAINPQTPSATPNESGVNKEVDQAVEKVARELHTLYKNKHEVKVSALKKSYEARWEKRVRELETRLEESRKENDDLRMGSDATMSGVLATAITVPAAEGSQTHNLPDEVAEMRLENSRLKAEIEKERREKGDLVAAVEEMLLISAASGSSSQPSSSGPSGASIPRTAEAKATAPNFGGSTTGESRIGKMGGVAASSKMRPLGLSGLGKSGIMSSIERMGRGLAE
ncbi:MAG: hypothetical protein M1829_000550 [Trizodia sp. TS-e1964]|nr:MAG: hypothetical protein M1829_000550 [Trizodia sp. TS-e1964]